MSRNKLPVHEFSPTIRSENSADVGPIRKLLTGCFPSPLEARLVDLLRENDRLSVSLVAEFRGKILGYVAFSPVTTESGQVGCGLAPLAVAPDYRRQGLGEKLVRAGLAAAANAGFGWAVVLGEPQYYGKFGFRPANSFGLFDEYGGGDAFQVKELSLERLPLATGLVKYGPEFAMFS
jgi:putative acetyltransferase